jgi:hypothetical protein
VIRRKPCARAGAPTRPPRAAAGAAPLAPRRARFRPVTPGDILAAARVLIAVEDRLWPVKMAQMLTRAEAAERYRRRVCCAHPRFGNGTLMAVAHPQAPTPEAGDRRFLAAMGAVIAAVLARSERFEGHGSERPADAGNVEQRL